MPNVNIQVGNLTFQFDSSARVGQYDQWVFYRNQFQNRCGTGNKAVDIVCVYNQTTWLIEVKDYRRHFPQKPISKLPGDVASKVRDTSAGLAAAQFNANDPQEKQLADLCLRSKRIRVVLHLEQPQKSSKLFPGKSTVTDVLDELRRLLKAVDAHPRVVDRHSLSAAFPWTVI